MKRHVFSIISGTFLSPLETTAFFYHWRQSLEIIALQNIILMPEFFCLKFIVKNKTRLDCYFILLSCLILVSNFHRQGEVYKKLCTFKNGGTSSSWVLLYCT